MRIAVVGASLIAVFAGARSWRRWCRASVIAHRPALPAPPGQRRLDRAGRAGRRTRPAGDRSIDPETSTSLSVYHIDSTSGEIVAQKRAQHPLGLANGRVQRHQPAAAGDSFDVGTEINRLTAAALGRDAICRGRRAETLARRARQNWEALDGPQIHRSRRSRQDVGRLARHAQRNARARRRSTAIATAAVGNSSPRTSKS